MSTKAGDSFPEGVVFNTIPYIEGSELGSCGVVQQYDASNEFANKKVVLFSVPGAFTPSCSEQHLPGYINNLDKIRAKGVDVVAVLAYNDAWVMNAWSKVNKIKNDDIIFFTDVDRNFSRSIGWLNGDRNARYALIIDHGKIVYAEKEPGKGVTVSSAEAVLSKL